MRDQVSRVSRKTAKISQRPQKVPELCRLAILFHEVDAASGYERALRAF